MHTEGSFHGAGGLVLHRQTWRPERPSRAVLVNLHGLGDHGGLYPRLVDHCAGLGWTVHAPDLRGNGRSLGPCAYIGSWNEFREDLGRFLQSAPRRIPAPMKPIRPPGWEHGGTGRGRAAATFSGWGGGLPPTPATGPPRSIASSSATFESSAWCGDERFAAAVGAWRAVIPKVVEPPCRNPHLLCS